MANGNGGSVSRDFAAELRAALENVATLMNEAEKAGDVYSFSIGRNETDATKRKGFFLEKMTVTRTL